MTFHRAFRPGGVVAGAAVALAAMTVFVNLPGVAASTAVGGPAAASGSAAFSCGGSRALSYTDFKKAEYSQAPAATTALSYVEWKRQEYGLDTCAVASTAVGVAGVSCAPGSYVSWKLQEYGLLPVCG